MSNGRLKNLINRKNSTPNGANGILANLFADIVRVMNITMPRFSHLLQMYVEDPRNGIPAIRKEQTTERGNLAKQLTKNQLTWKVFCKGLQILKIKRIKFTVTATWANDKITEHSTYVELANADLNNESEKDDETPDERSTE
jgi:hypothetical protein